MFDKTTIPLLRMCVNWEKEAREMGLNEVKTCELMEELRDREGVEIIQAEPYQQMDISVEGPAVILIVTD